MKFHLIAIGGSAMHNLALALLENHQIVSGSDDEIYNPSRERLFNKALLPDKMGWYPERITSDIDAVILGMHARNDNPELIKAKKMGLPIYSYPEFIYQHSKEKKRIVIAGSHGKTTTTSMIMVALQKLNFDFDYLVGAQIEGFETMVKLSDAPIMVIEGDEYLSSPIDPRPKMLLYNAHIAVITGIAWDHMNVFKTFEDYKNQFSLFVDTLEKGGVLIGYHNDEIITGLMRQRTDITTLTYSGFELVDDAIIFEDEYYPIQIFGRHNLENLKAAALVCLNLGIKTKDFLYAVRNFVGASKRLQLLSEKERFVAFKDFAHAPSKVKATISAVREKYQDKKLIVFLELHTFSSLNKEFIPQYAGSLDLADRAYVYYDEHTLEMKNLPPLSEKFIKNSFKNDKLIVTKNSIEIRDIIVDSSRDNTCFLFMSSGNFGGIDLEALF